MNGNCYSSDGVNPTLTTNKGEGNKIVIPVDGPEKVGNLFKSGGQAGNVYYSENVGPCLPGFGAGGGGKEAKVAIPVLTPDRANKRQNGRRFKEDGDEAFTLTGQDRHGVAIEVNPEVIGGIGEKNFGKQWRQGNRIYDGEKVATALEAQPVGNAGGNTNLYAIEIEPVQMSGCKLSKQTNEAHSLNCTDQRKVFGAHQSRTMVGYNATLKRGGGTTQTAMTLNARDYKGLSGSNQMMTTAMMCLQSTRESNQKNEPLRTASKQGKTEGCQNENRKER